MTEICVYRCDRNASFTLFFRLKLNNSQFTIIYKTTTRLSLRVKIRKNKHNNIH